MEKLIVEIQNNHLVFFHRSFLPVADFVLQDRHEEDLCLSVPDQHRVQ